MAKRERIRWKNHAIQLVAVAAGVYLALSVKQWQDERSNQHILMQHLADVQNDLLQDREAVRDHLRSLRALSRKCTLLLRHSSERKLADDSIMLALKAISSPTAFHPHLSAYRMLAADHDMARRMDFDLRRALAAWYLDTCEDLRTLDAHLQQPDQHLPVSRVLAMSAGNRPFFKSAAFQKHVQVRADRIRQKIEAYTNAETQVANLLRQLNPDEL